MNFLAVGTGLEGINRSEGKYVPVEPDKS